jgi:hypothetical protein
VASLITLPLPDCATHCRRRGSRRGKFDLWALEIGRHSRLELILTPPVKAHQGVQLAAGRIVFQHLHRRSRFEMVWFSFVEKEFGAEFEIALRIFSIGTKIQFVIH